MEATTAEENTMNTQIQQLMEIVLEQTFNYMDRTGATLAEAQDAAAEWIFNEHPTLAAAITLSTSAN
jgi:hypothetical protein